MTTYRRRAEAVYAQLQKSPTGVITTKAVCKIQVPARYTESSVNLGSTGIDTFVYGLFALILESGDYAVCNINAKVQIKPRRNAIVLIDDVEYHEFYFEPGDIVIATTDVIREEDLVYNVFDEFIFKGKIPWYVGYEDLGKIFDTSSYYIGVGVDRRVEVVEMIVSMVGRSSSDRTKYIRTVAKSHADINPQTLSYVPLKSVFYSVNNTLNKIAGAYFHDGVTSALVAPSEQVSNIEAILRQ